MSLLFSNTQQGLGAVGRGASNRPHHCYFLWMNDESKQPFTWGQVAKLLVLAAGLTIICGLGLLMGAGAWKAIAGI